MKPYFDPSPIVLAHRGDSAFYPENTMPAFRNAQKLGVDVVETDVHLTTDGKCVIWHDDTIDRMTDKTGTVSKMTWDELAAADAGYQFTNDDGKSYPFRGQGIGLVLFEDLLDALPDQRFNVDLKDNNPALAKEFARIIRSRKAESRVCVGSFHTANMLIIRKLVPEMANASSPAEIKKMVILHKIGLGAFISRGHGDVLPIPEFDENNEKIRIISKRFIKRMHKKGYLIQVWTVNTKEDMNRMLDWGVDGIFTDDPRLLMDVVSSR